MPWREKERGRCFRDIGFRELLNLLSRRHVLSLRDFGGTSGKPPLKPLNP